MKINDKNILIAFVITPLAAALILAAVSAYSLFSVEPRVVKLLSSPDTLKDAYIELREPQLFAGYKNWDREGNGVLNTIRFFDNRVFYGAGIRPEEKPYLELLLDRRHSGAVLGMKTAAFLVLVSVMGAVALAVETRNSKKQ